jgi:hypothetical protein
MTGIDILNIIAGIITIGSFIFALWVFIRSEMKIKELRDTLNTIDDIAGTAIWEFHVAPARDYELRLRQAEKILGFMTSIRKITERYSSKIKTTFDTSITLLLNKNILWTIARLYDFELSRKVTEAWIVSKDLKPDAFDEEVGKLIYKNLRNGTNYVYFCSEQIPHLDSEISRLYKNLNANDGKIKNQVKVIKISTQNEDIFSNGNIALYFHDETKNSTPRCFQEIVFSQLTDKGAFWQEHDGQRANDLKYMLEAEILAKEQKNN